MWTVQYPALTSWASLPEEALGQLEKEVARDDEPEIVWRGELNLALARSTPKRIYGLCQLVPVV